MRIHIIYQEVFTTSEDVVSKTHASDYARHQGAYLVRSIHSPTETSSLLVRIARVRGVYKDKLHYHAQHRPYMDIQKYLGTLRIVNPAIIWRYGSSAVN